MSCNDYKHVCPASKLYHHGRLCVDCKGGGFYKAVVNRCCKDSWRFSVASSIEAYAHRFTHVYEKDVDRYLFASRFMARLTQDFWAQRPLEWSLLRNPFTMQRSPVREGGDYVLYFGRLSDEKGVGTLLDALSRLQGTPARIVGDGPLEADLRRQTERLGLRNVEFVGPKWGTELDPWLRSARFVVVPSVWYENFPYVILQSFAAGKAVIGSDRGGIPELIKTGQYGLTYPGGDDVALASAIEQLWNDPQGTATMGMAARRYVDLEFTDERFYEALTDIYRGVLR